MSVPPPILTRTFEQTMAASLHASAEAVQAPTTDLLDFLAAQNRDENNRADIDASPWICYGPCADLNYGIGAVYHPVRNSLVDLPYPRCFNCGTVNPASYEWRMTDISLYNVNLDVPVLNQGPVSSCSQYACATAVLLGAKLESVRYPEAPLYTGDLNLPEFVRRFYDSYQHPKDSGSSIPLTLRFIRDYGIPIGSNNPAYQVGEEYNLGIANYWQANHWDVPLLTRLLASGFPLVALIESGRRFSFINGNEVYDGPPPGAQPGERLCHSVALIGSGLRLRNVPRADGTMHAVYDTYFVVRDSHGPFAHGSSARSFADLGQTVGYDFNVWASSLLEVWGFYQPQG